jgi:mono/diheme cytochrome c family protein
MSERRRFAIPVAAGLAAAAAAFAVVAFATDGGDRAAREPVRATTDADGGAGRATKADRVARGRLVFAQMGCGGCHTLAAAGSTGPIGPDLDDRPAAHTRGSLRAKITDPGPASMMPDDFARRMSAGDLRALVDFLLAQRSRSG